MLHSARWLFLIVALLLTGATSAQANDLLFRVGIAGFAGDFKVDLYDDTPVARQNFLDYVTADLLDNTVIHRKATLANSGVDVLQGGGFYYTNNVASEVPGFPPIASNAEATRSNTTGTIAMAENNLGYTSQWFINTGDNPALDGEFVVFGEVSFNYDLVEALWNLQAVDASNIHPAWTNLPVLTTDSGTYLGLVTDIVELPELGDMNNNGSVDAGDVDPFIMGLNDPQGFFDLYGMEAWWMGDINNDGVLNNFDIAGFRALIPGGDALVIPEPTSGMLALMVTAPLLARRRR